MFFVDLGWKAAAHRPARHNLLLIFKDPKTFLRTLPILLDCPMSMVGTPKVYCSFVFDYHRIALRSSKQQNMLIVFSNVPASNLQR